ncbi:hypothetical protein ElyMa_004344100 [Elysia marginata]|uniref:Uncharacterized protein n=1 Tax=Elysia marginata TaxID=1093978 RepID=A0AAV4H2E6_9GAST|nr:hypothetical protein ElyMa_004344100 [Elysia marginata]
MKKSCRKTRRLDKKRTWAWLGWVTSITVHIYRPGHGNQQVSISTVTTDTQQSLLLSGLCVVTVHAWESLPEDSPACLPAAGPGSRHGLGHVTPCARDNGISARHARKITEEIEEREGELWSDLSRDAVPRGAVATSLT